MTSADSHRLIILEELNPHSKSKTYGKSMRVVSRVKGIKPNDDDIVLDHLTTDQVRLFARNIGVPNLGSKNKFVCRFTMASHFQFQHQLSSFGLSPTSPANQTTANVCRAVNVIFSNQFIDELKKVNNKKSRTDHESGNTHKHFWIQAAMAYNNGQDDDVVEERSTDPTAVAVPEENKSTTEDEFSTLIVSYEDPVLADLDANEEVYLEQFEQMETNAFRKKCLDLFKVRSIMKENMMKSGTHDSDLYNFVEVAMRGFTGLTPICVFYFYKRCDEHPDIDSVFQPFMNDNLKGNSITLGTCDDDDTSPSTIGSTSKTVLFDQMDMMVKQGSQLLDLLKMSVEEQKLERLDRKQERLDCDKRSTINSQIEIAKALGDRDELRRLSKQLKESLHEHNSPLTITSTRTSTKALGGREYQHCLTIECNESNVLTILVLFLLFFSNLFPIILAHSTFSRITISLYNRNNSLPIVGIGSFTINHKLHPFVVSCSFT